MKKAYRLPLTRPNVPVRNGRAAYRFSGSRKASPKSDHRKRVMVFGTFDHLHPGHKFFLREGLRRGSLTVVVARDETVQRIKGRKPTQPQEERRCVIRRRFPTVSAILGDRKDFLRPLRAVRPDLILLGYDQLLPPGITESLLPCPIERARPFQPHRFKSRFSRERTKEGVESRGKR